MSTAAVVLAAGPGSRFGVSSEKLLTSSHGRPLLAHALAAAAGAGLDELVVVAGATDIQAVVPASATLLLNADWKSGIATSLRVAVDWCQRQGHTSMVIGLGDQPAVTAEDWTAVANGTGGQIIVATYRGQRSYPVRLPAELWPSLPIDGDHGVEVVIARHQGLVAEVACSGRLVDIDTPEDMRRWQ